MADQTIAKFRPWKVFVQGVLTTIKVLSTGSPDQVGQAAWTYQDEYDNTRAYSAGSMVRITRVFAYHGITPALGWYACLVDTQANGTGNQVPQFVNPAATVSGIQYWVMVAFSPKAVSVCSNGDKKVYANVSNTF